jgi:hypothetical protein
VPEDAKTGAKRPTLPEMLRLKITYRKVADLKPYAGNARTRCCQTNSNSSLLGQ